MKKAFTTVILLLCTFLLHAQTVSTFESLVLGTDTFWDGSDQSGGFQDGNAWFHNSYDSNWMYWSAGWAYSNVQDSVSSGVGNLFAAKALTGYNASANYAVGQQYARIVLNGQAAGGAVNGLYVTNSTYAYNSMRDGDMFAKKFGGVTGNDPDFFSLTFRKYYGGLMTSDSVVFYLADFRFSNNAQDYLVKDWTWVDLTSLGLVDSLELQLNSSDTGAFGINTPLFYCIDNFTTADGPLAVEQTSPGNISIYPNPATDFLSVNLMQGSVAQLYLYDANGRILTDKITGQENLQIDLRGLPPGIYFLRMENGEQVQSIRFVKN